MVNTLHIGALFLGLLAYIFSDVNSTSGFTNTFLPFIVLLSFIYGLIVTINILYTLRKKPNQQDKATDILLANMKDLKNKEQSQKEVEEQE